MNENSVVIIARYNEFKMWSSIIAPFTEEEASTDGLSNLPKVTQLVNRRPGTM